MHVIRPYEVGSMGDGQVDVAGHRLPEGAGPQVEEPPGVLLVLGDVHQLGGVEGLQHLPLRLQELLRDGQDFCRYPRVLEEPEGS